MNIFHDKNLSFFKNELSKDNPELWKWWERLKNKEDLFALLNSENVREISNFNYDFHKNEFRNNPFWFQISSREYGSWSSIEYQNYQLACIIKEVLKINKNKFMTIGTHNKYIEIIKMLQKIQAHDYIPFDIKNLEYTKIGTIITICEDEIKKLESPENYNRSSIEKSLRDDKLTRLKNIKKYLKNKEENGEDSEDNNYQYLRQDIYN